MNREMYDNYIIKKGDTLFGISKQYNINPELLSLVNGLNMNDYIYENQEILIPKSGYSYYLTKSGDNLNDILNLFKVNYNEFSKVNDKLLLEEGQLLAYKRV
ncbi:MAG: LysM peptidoglycan-binding domain-containing protein [Bacilli bacterium]|nr:LysM peptidoglycan-binding domain-containing protein [Bacilli bacterium]